MYFRKATPDDLDSIMEIVADAQHSLGSRGIDQWQDGYPTREGIERDIELGVGEVVIEDGEIAAYVCIMINGEPFYEQIEGKWLSMEDYVVVHRICVRNTFVRRGIATAILRHAAEFAVGQGVFDFKIDTHKDNTYMLDLLSKLGFQYCGVIHYLHGDRVAYERRLEGPVSR